MTRKVSTTLLLLSILLLPLTGIQPAVAAAPAAGASPDLVEDSLIDVWVFEDADQNGIYSAGDTGFTDVGVCVLNKDTNINSCGGTDYGDVWWEIREAGKFVITVKPDTLPAGYKLHSILCKYTRLDQEYQDCGYNLTNWKTKAKLPYSTRINVFYGVVRTDQ